MDKDGKMKISKRFAAKAGALAAEDAKNQNYNAFRFDCISSEGGVVAGKWKHLASGSTGKWEQSLWQGDDGSIWLHP